VPVADPDPVFAVGVGVEQALRATALVSRVTAPLRARARPFRVAPVVSEIDVSARTLPANALAGPSVAELPTCQNTLHACAPPVSSTRLAEPTVSVDPAWKMNTALGSPPASSVRAPLRPSELAEV